ncbi:MAG: hypothetical protein AAF206_27660, partial [Bacteroidota bacterium]
MMNQEQSLAIITEMIAEAKATFRDDGFFYLLWGWATLLAAISHFALLMLTGDERSGLIWAIFILGALIASVIVGRRKTRAAKARTWLMRQIMYLWTGLGIVYFLLIGAGIFRFMPFDNVYPVLIMLYGLGTYLSGSFLRFRPLVIGGIICWPLGLLTFLVPFQYQLLCIALGISISY